MDVSAPRVLLGFFAIMCAVSVAYGSRWVSRRSDAVLESTRLALRSQHAVPEPPDASGHAPVLDTAPDTGADARVPDDELESTGRHRVPEELMRASTYLLSPDRIARARVPSPRFQDLPDPVPRHDT